MTVDDSAKSHWLTSQAANDQTRQRLAVGSGDGHPPGMDTELALLKQRADQADQRMARMEGTLDRMDDRLVRITEVLGSVATRNTVWAALGTGAAIAFAVVGVFIAILTYLQDQRIATRPEPAPAAAVAPMILQLPPWPTPPASPAAPQPATPPG
ncbi:MULTISPECIES: hypothetical protein [Roseomonadaceae]|uniref:DUF1515 domain-containing protein n=1 Tax=Falsiroseomonas oleicola TaxID=2801474 RepID=A0ABS6H9X9_9PROT|nr:hypothetical protein [Roseomonas oleicola]MBU8545510.1 hypothetical protein [Roseomonas oleicola]